MRSSVTSGVETDGALDTKTQLLVMGSLVQLAAASTRKEIEKYFISRLIDNPRRRALN
jgi:hypothetical protein